MVLNRWERTETYISIASLTAAASIFAGALLFEARPYHKIFLSGSAIALSTTALILSKTKGSEARRYNQLAINSQWEKAMILSEHGLEDLYKRLHPRAAQEWQEAELIEGDMQQALPPGEDDNYYNWDDLADASSGLIVAGQTGYGKSTSAIAAAIELTKTKPAYVAVYDKHAKKNRWHEFGLNPIHKIEKIESGIMAMGEELKARQDRDENGPPIIIIIDELISSKKAFADWKAVIEIIENLLIEGRKFDMTAMLLTQSINVGAIGLDASIRANAFWILLGELARRQFRKGSDELAMLDQTAYPCCVSGCVSTQIAKHLTHGHHTQFKKVGVVPKFNGKINQLQGDPFEFTRSLQGGKASGDRIQPPHIDLEKTDEPREENNPIKTLEALILNDSDLPASLLSEAEWEFFGEATSNADNQGKPDWEPFTVRNCQRRSPVCRREDWSADRIKEIFHKFSEMGLGEIVQGQKGLVEFRVNGEK